MFNKYNYAIYALEILLFCLTFCVLIFSLCAFGNFDNNCFSEANAFASTVKIVIDAGHGGRDGGASSTNGVLEKDLNLSVATALNEILQLCGVESVMTRAEDNLVCDENDPTLKGKIKSTDLKNRLELACEYSDAIFVSIHMNKFSIEKYKGLQVYYSKNNEKSFVIAKLIQDRICSILQHDNSRKVKKANSSIFLLDRIKSPAILIECGFLSNESDTENLVKTTYQTTLSLIFAECLLQNLS